MPHADPVRRAQGPRVQVVQGALGGAALLLQAPRGAPSTGASGGGCAIAHASRDGGTVCALPPSPKGGGQRWRQWGGGHAGLGRCAGTHKALWEPATGPWEGGGGRHLTQGTQSFRRAATPRVGGGRGWPAKLVLEP